MEKDYYVILTGSKNNAGDFLIKYRAKRLLQTIRPDRNVVDIDAWKPFDNKTLDLVNHAKALILMGGPALQKNMYPGIYPLVDDLNRIKTKIVLMGVGWKSLNGDWQASREYKFSPKTLGLLQRLETDGLSNSVRDYHSLNALWSNGFNSGVMTGCPATYDLDAIGKVYPDMGEVSKIGFSLGVSFLASAKMEQQMKGIIIDLKDYFKGKDFEVVFHHSTKNQFLQTHNATKRHLLGHQKFIRWLEDHKITHVDISGAAESLMEYYQTCDLHIGYRVHAHIFMNSISRPSILIAEDGRGRALGSVFGGVVIDAFNRVDEKLLAKVFRKFNVTCGFSVPENLVAEVRRQVEYEIDSGFLRCRSTRPSIDSNFEAMKKFIDDLP